MARDVPRSSAPASGLLAGRALLVLRGFLSVVFLYAGLEKLANPQFLNASSPISIYAQLSGSVHTSPIGSLLRPLLGHANDVGVVIALGEVAVGIGMALGLFTRVAAVGGAIISCSLFLTVSFHASPWFTGADIVYVFAFTPFLIAGAGSAVSLDAYLARRTALVRTGDDVRPVVVPFERIKHACGVYDAGACTAAPGRECAPEGCPFIEGTLPGSGAAPVVEASARTDTVDRRTVVLHGAAAAAAAAAGIVLAGTVAGAGRLIGDAKKAPTTAKSTTVGGSAGDDGVLLGPESKVPLGGAASYTLASSGDPIIVLQPSAGEFVCYSAICPHAGCTVGYDAQLGLILCPCHHSEFAVANGDVLQGPAQVGLTPLGLKESDGQLYLS